MHPLLASNASYLFLVYITIINSCRSFRSIKRAISERSGSISRFFGRSSSFRRTISHLRVTLLLFRRVLLLFWNHLPLLRRLSIVVLFAGGQPFLLGCETHRCVGPYGVSPCCGFQKCTSLTSVGVPAFSCSSIFSWLVLFWSPSGLCGALVTPELIVWCPLPLPGLSVLAWAACEIISSICSKQPCR